MKLLEILWIISTITCSGSVIAMLYIYRSMEQSLFTLSTVIHQLILHNHRSEQYGTGIPSMAEDTEVAE